MLNNLGTRDRPRHLNRSDFHHRLLGAFDFGEMEAAFYRAAPVPPDQAVREFPAGHVFADAAAAALHSEAEPGWNSLLLLYDCSYSPERAHPSKACRLQFVGSFGYR